VVRGRCRRLAQVASQRDLRRCCIELGGDGLDLVDDAQVLLEVALSESWIVLAPVVVGQILGERI
jgi:hypothetical protein